MRDIDDYMVTRLCQWILQSIGWGIVGKFPDRTSYILIVGPHTSNWDFIIGMLARGALGQQIHFLGKHQLFLPPWGWFFKWIGGSPVDRRKNNNLVDAVAELFKQDKNYKLALAPEGTRAEVKRWKTGFYHIAKQAKVCIVPIGLDFSKKQVIIGNNLLPTDNMARDMQQLLTFFRTIKGYRPKTIPDYQ